MFGLCLIGVLLYILGIIVHHESNIKSYMKGVVYRMMKWGVGM